MKKEHCSKMIAPIIIAIILIVYYVAIAAGYCSHSKNTYDNHSAGIGRSSICGNCRTCE